MTNKLKAKLAEQLKQAAASDQLEIILELSPVAEAATMAVPEALSRSEKIAAKKEAFNRNLAAVEEAIRKVGGEITGRAWLNQTVRALVPAQAIKELSEHEQVAALDLPNLIKPDIGSTSG